MIITTTPTLEGRPVRDYLGIVTGEAIIGANIFKDLFAAVRDVVGGRSNAYERALSDTRARMPCARWPSAPPTGAPTRSCPSTWTTR